MIAHHRRKKVLTNITAWNPIVKILLVIIIFCGLVAIASVFYRHTITSNSSTGNAKLVFAKTPTLPKDFTPSLRDYKYKCPTTSVICQTESNFKGASLSAQLKKGDPIIAAFEGDMSVLPSTYWASNPTETYTLVLIDNKYRGLQAEYYLKGKTIDPKFVTVGTVIATSSGQPMAFMNNSTFVFRLNKLYANGMRLSNLTPGDFEK